MRKRSKIKTKTKDDSNDGRRQTFQTARPDESIDTVTSDDSIEMPKPASSPTKPIDGKRLEERDTCRDKPACNRSDNQAIDGAQLLRQGSIRHQLPFAKAESTLRQSKSRQIESTVSDQRFDPTAFRFHLHLRLTFALVVVFVFIFVSIFGFLASHLSRDNHSHQEPPN